MSLLHRGEPLPEGDSDPGPVRGAELIRGVPQLELVILLQRGADRGTRQGVRLHQMRQVRKGLPAASSDPGTVEKSGGTV